MTLKNNQPGRLIKPPRLGSPVILASLGVNMLALAMPLVVLQVFDRVIPFESYATLLMLFLGLCVVATLDFALKVARIVMTGHQGERFETDLSARFVARSLNAEPTSYDTSSIGAHLERLNALSQLRDYYCGQGRLMALDIPFTAVFIIMIGLIGGWLVLVPLTCLLLLYGFKFILQRAQGPIFEKRKTLDGRRYSFLIECLSQIVTVKADTMERQLQRRYELLQEQSVNISEKLVQFSGFSQSFGALFSQASVAAMGLFGGFLVIVGQIGLAELAACMLLNGRTVQPLLKMLSHWAQTESTQAARAKIEEIEALEQRGIQPNRASDLKGHLQFESVSVSNPSDARDILTDISFDLPAGKTLSVLAKVGSGRDAFMRLILGEETTAEGCIRLDEKPIHAFSSTRGRGGIVYVDQNPVVFPGTLLQNISCFGEGEAIERAIVLSAQLGLEKKVHRMPMGYNTVLGSVGEISSSLALLQTVALVRALALQPKLLLFNNATSALDDRGIAKVARALASLQGNATVVMSTPRKRLLELADQTVILSGSYSEDFQLWDDDATVDAMQTKHSISRTA